jgi:hypothetical protein
LAEGADAISRHTPQDATATRATERSEGRDRLLPLDCFLARPVLAGQWKRLVDTAVTAPIGAEKSEVLPIAIDAPLWEPSPANRSPRHHFLRGGSLYES